MPVNVVAAPLPAALPCEERHGVAYVYLTRVPLLSLIALLLLPFVALDWAPSLLGALFDVESGALWTVAAVAGMLAYTITTTAGLVLAYGHLRYAVPRVAFPSPGGTAYGMRSLLLTAPVFIGVFRATRQNAVSDLPPRVGWFVLAGIGGLAIAYTLFRLVPRLDSRLPLRTATDLLSPIFTRVPVLQEGFIDAHGTALPGHRFALGLGIVSFGVYLVVGLSYGQLFGHQVPTLAYLLLLIMIACWALTFLTFVFDRYRVPLVALIGVWVAITGFGGWSDHYYQLVPALPPGLPSAAQVLGARGETSAIVVAANGGGIQAAAWTARVLAGLQGQCREELGPRCRFDQSVRLISSVSGGSVGAMYVASQYSEYGLPDDDVLEDMVAWASTSSLDHVGWGLLYRDLLRPFSSPNDVQKYEDRGWALEQAWGRFGDFQSPLSTWRAGVAEGWRPASIFNATVADSGERLVIGTSALERRRAGRKRLSELYPDRDVAISTAARLSATFPYVSAAARADTPSATFHVADGAYYDNYGMASVIDWLDEALSAPGSRVTRVLVLQLRGAPPDHDPRDRTRGWFYQAYAPLATMLNVRTSAQLTHNEEELDLLRRAYAGRVAIDSAVFQFCGEGAPLSWHLTAPQRRAIDAEWRTELAAGSGWRVVKGFLEGGSTYPIAGSRCRARADE